MSTYSPCPGDRVRLVPPLIDDLPETGTVATPTPADSPEPMCLGKVTPGRWVLVEWPACPERNISGARFWERADALRPVAPAMPAVRS